jgi:hypothetical protein
MSDSGDRPYRAQAAPALHNLGHSRDALPTPRLMQRM